MKHSKRPLFVLSLFIVEFILVSVPFVTGALSAKENWEEYWRWTLLALVAFTIIRAAQLAPSFIDLFAFESAAAKMARSAMAYGVQRLYNMSLKADQSARNADTIAAIAIAPIMFLSANSGASYLDPDLSRHWNSVRARLEARVQFRVVLLNPFSDEKKFRNTLNHNNEDPDHKLNLANLLRISIEFPSLEIRFTDRGMYGTIFATHESAFFDPYHLAVKGGRLDNLAYCLQIQDTNPPHNDGYIKTLRGHFDSLWDQATPLKDWHAQAIREGKQVPPWPKKG